MSLEIVVVVGLFMLLFGYRKLPKLGRAVGKAPRYFTDGLEEDS